MSDKRIDFDINDPRASAIAEAMANKTCKAILNLLAEKELSVSEIAEKLKIPLNTASYNIDKLLKAGLVEKSSWLWSIKGKRMEKYRLSNKKIVISPKRIVFVPTFITIFVVLALMVAFLGLQYQNKRFIESPDESFKRFNSLQELKDFLKEKYNKYPIYIGERVFGGEALGDVSSAALNAKNAAGASDYSRTNIQVEGVDEPDFVKNDGKYIYLVSNEMLYIVEAYPAENMRIVANFSVGNGHVSNIFLNGDKLIVFSQEIIYSQVYKDYATSAESPVQEPDYIVPRKYEQKAKVYVYDVENRENPEMKANISLSGNFVDARMIGDYIYVITRESTYNNIIPYYEINGIKKDVDVRSIYYPVHPGNYDFTTISSINLDNLELDSKTFLIDSYGVNYVSQNNIYLSYQKYYDYTSVVLDVVKNFMLPQLPVELRKEIKEVIDSNKKSYAKIQEISRLIQNYSSTLRGDEKAEFDEKIKNIVEETEKRVYREYSKTVIHKISFDKGEINYDGFGEVPGYLLNQFSMDEYKGKLRVATTIGDWRNSENNLYVLDSKMNIIGEVEGLAPGERIYSARFIGERAYMVTFRQVDPLFVIDLSNPKNPEVLGYLKVTGYSSYLHPYDKDTIIGIGMEANEEGRTTGLKIALFDVSDPEKPVQKAKYELEKPKSGWVSSEALNNHKAFLFSKEKKLLVIPIQITTYDYSSAEYYYNYESAAYVFDIRENKIWLKGKIVHSDKSGYGSNVERSLYMDDVLYTISRSKIKANLLSNLEEIGEVNLTSKTNNPSFEYIGK